MLALLAIFLISVGGAFSGDSKCGAREVENCNVRRVPMSRPTQIEEEFDLYCQSSIARLDCILEALNNCDDADLEEKRHLSSVNSFLKQRLCNEDSDLHKVIFDNLYCIARTMSVVPQVCGRETMGEQQKKMASGLEDLLLDAYPEMLRADEDEGLKMCSTAVFVGACASLMMSDHCGENVGDAALETMVMVGDKFQQCPAQLREDLPEVLRAVRLIGEAAKDIKRRK